MELGGLEPPTSWVRCHYTGPRRVIEGAQAPIYRAEPVSASPLMAARGGCHVPVWYPCEWDELSQASGAADSLGARMTLSAEHTEARHADAQWRGGLCAGWADESVAGEPTGVGT
jgi:hypothetical protein